MDSNTKPTVKWVLLPMAGLKDEDAAASQTSSSGLDMCGADAMSVNECLYSTRYSTVDCRTVSR